MSSDSHSDSDSANGFPVAPFQMDELPQIRIDPKRESSDSIHISHSASGHKHHEISEPVSKSSKLILILTISPFVIILLLLITGIIISIISNDVNIPEFDELRSVFFIHSVIGSITSLFVTLIFIYCHKRQHYPLSYQVMLTIAIFITHGTAITLQVFSSEEILDTLKSASQELFIAAKLSLFSFWLIYIVVSVAIVAHLSPFL
eukprot:gnl/Dysnectes_brevis/1188_a1328_2648.p1 GENE.gnl/Dysnectes_brevis/1188_a1328_2648~~gnl/Dysnectes_brevis/1188_a1328_2648.p1  ORF type:complete len:204 (-),score=16.64 gnl/Dysnectes_brevis/1188_a1328_2648:145-756(-)